MSMEDYDFLFKIVLIGNAGVGKTCLVRRFTQGLFPPGQGATIGVDFMIKTVEINGEKVKATRLIWLKGERSPSRELKNSQKLRTCIIWRPQPRNPITWRNSSLTWPAASSVKPGRTHL
uniref:RAB30, member RAS oncogene family n=1 Tax=Balaenoptera musculus TaxID=9771 RepID=A0A8C0CJR2_BALMU